MPVRNIWAWSVIIGIVIVVWGVIVWFGHITVIHAIASIIVFIGLSVALGGVNSRGPGGGPVA